MELSGTSSESELGQEKNAQSPTTGSGSYIYQVLNEQAQTTRGQENRRL